MLKDSTAVIGLGLGGMTVTYEFQERNYLTYSVNGSEQDIKSIPNAKNSMRLEGYDGLAGNRELVISLWVRVPMVSINHYRIILMIVTRQIEERLNFLP